MKKKNEKDNKVNEDDKMDIPLKDNILDDLKTKLQKRVIVLQHRIEMHEKENPQQVNKEQLLKWMMELQEVQFLLEEVETPKK